MKALAGEVLITNVPLLNVLAPFVAVLVKTAFARIAPTPATIATKSSESRIFFNVSDMRLLCLADYKNIYKK